MNYMYLKIHLWMNSLILLCDYFFYRQQYEISKLDLKGIAQMTIMSPFTHPQVIPRMSLCCWTQRKIFWRMWETEQFWDTIDYHSIYFPTMEVNGAPKQPVYKLSSKYLPLCSAEQIHSYRLGTTWGWVNDDTIVLFGWTIPLIG